MQIDRRVFVQAGAGSLVAAALPLQAPAAMAHSALAATAFTPLPLGQIRPAGWLRRQLRIQADGLGGHLDEFWPDVGPNSGWLGGSGESWERGPYFVDGLLPLAWQLEDDVLKAKAMRFVNWTLDHPQPNGMIGPTSNQDWWPRMVMLKVLAQYYDATEAAGTPDPRVIPVMTRYLHYQLATLPQQPLRDWGKYRWQDEAMVVAWLYARTADPVLLQLAALLQQQGFDWVESFAHFQFTGPTTRAFLSSTAVGGNKPQGMQTHGVNNGQALKTAAVEYRFSGDRTLQAKFGRQLGALDRYHGEPNGMFSCDEHLAGLDPSHGTELCTVVETLFSLETTLATFGDPALGDRIEKIAFNALPGTFDDSMWAHQYDQQSNQVQVGLNSKPWTTNGPESNLYGLEPNFGCCTANFHQGWPKLTQHLWMRSPDGGLVAALYAPCRVDTQVNGHKVRLEVQTDYPFRDTVRIVLTPESSMRFPLRLRVPAWTSAATLQINGIPSDVQLKPGSFALVEQVWAPGDTVELTFPMRPQVTRWFHGSMAISRGPLVFSHDPGENWVKLRDRGMTADWQVYPASFWNYGLRTSEAGAAQLEVAEAPVGARPFAREATAVQIRVPARRLDSWRSEDGVAAPVPEGAQRSVNAEEMLTLVPYAAAKLRITAFPELAEPAREGDSHPA